MADGSADVRVLHVTTSNAKKLLSDAMELPTEDRARLAAALLASLDDGVDDDADRAWAVEIERRADRVLAGGSNGEPWPAVRARLLARLQRG
jgi:putative addiction module component (TIGR02574 family)